MSNQVTSLSFDTSSKIRISFINSEPYFCLADVCNILQLSNPSKVAELIKEEFGTPNLKLGVIQSTNNRELTAYFISKKQLYFVMMRSRSPIAKKFRAWVYEVVEKLEKDGIYAIQPAVQPKQQPKAEEPTRNYLSNAEMANLKTLIYRIAGVYEYRQAAITAIWKVLRTRTGVSSPNRFEIKHLPIIVKELQRIINISDRYQRKTLQLEKKIFKQVFKVDDDTKLDELLSSCQENVIYYGEMEIANCIKDRECLRLLSLYKEEIQNQQQLQLSF